jgi:diguanylate cyclase (GGDEF)-like protein
MVGPIQELSISLLNPTQQISATDKLSRSEERFRTSIEALLDGLAIFSSIRDPDGGIVDFRYEYINEAGCRLNQRSRAEQIGHTLLEMLPAHKKAGLLDEYIQVVETGKPFTGESVHYEDEYGGGLRLARVLDIRAIKLGDGFVAHWRDVTERKRLEQKETDQRILAETLEETARFLNSTLLLEEVLDRILLLVERVVPYDAAHIMLVEAGEARIVRSQGYSDPGQQEAISTLRIQVEKIKNLKMMAETGEPVTIPDTWVSPDWVMLPVSLWIRSYVGVPMQVKGQTIGFINANSAEPGRYGSDSARRLQAFADQAALAIVNARLFEDIQRFARQSALLNDITNAAVSAPEKSKMLQRLADRLGELIHADGAFIMLWDEVNQRTIPAAAYGALSKSFTSISLEPGEMTLTSSVLNANRVLAVEDITTSPYLSPRLAAQLPARAVLGLPLIADGKKLGAALISFNQPHCFSIEEIEIAKQASAQIALAVWKAQLLQTERDRTAQLARANSFILALVEVAAQIDAAYDADEVLKTLGAELNKLGVTCLVASHAEETRTLQIQYVSLRSRAFVLAEKIARIRIENFQISGEQFLFYERVLEGRRPVFSAEPLKVLAAAVPGRSSSFVQRLAKIAGISGASQMLFLPLITRERVIGTLWMWGENLLESDLASASIFASQVAVTLENARLYSEIKRLAVTDELTSLYNRRGGLELGQREFKRAVRHSRPISAILLDIDHFKDVNDTYGHILGDQVLQSITEQFRNHLRVTDIPVRFGGEEFLVILPEANLASAVGVAERLRELVAESVVLVKGGAVQITISAGVAERTPRMQDLMELINHADQAMYCAKQSGRNQVVAA